MRIPSYVGASVFAGVFLHARDLTEKTLTYVNEKQNQNRKLNSPACGHRFLDLS